MKIFSLLTWFSRPKKVEPTPLTAEQIAVNKEYYQMEERLQTNAVYGPTHTKVLNLNSDLISKFHALVTHGHNGFHIEIPADLSLKLLLEQDTLTCCSEHPSYLEFWLSETDITNVLGPANALLRHRGLHLGRVAFRERPYSQTGHILVCTVERLAAAA